MQNNIPIFKCRASAMGKIMTNPRSKKDLISQTCKTFLKEWIIEKKYHRRKDFSSKHTEKGKLTEENGIDLIQEVVFNNTSFLIKNYKRFEDDYFSGEHDIEVLNFIIDNKSSWDIWTFPHLEDEIPIDGYDYQGRVYMRLRNKENFLLCYTLNDIPVDLLQDEFSRYKWSEKIIDETDQQYYDFAKKYIYTEKGLEDIKFMLFPNADTSDFVEVHSEKRIKSFVISRDLEIENKMIQRVLECREWISENWDKF